MALLLPKLKFKKFWQCTYELNAKTSAPVCVGDTSRPSDIANLFLQHFKVQSPLGMPSRFDTEVIGKLNIVIFAKHIKMTIKRMSKGKSSGRDGFCLEHVRRAGAHLPRILAMLHNLCLSHSYLPSDLV